MDDILGTHRAIVASRLSFHAPTKAYMARRLAEDKSRREVIRILKRYVAQKLYRYLPRP